MGGEWRLILAEVQLNIEEEIFFIGLPELIAKSTSHIESRYIQKLLFPLFLHLNNM